MSEWFVLRPTIPLPAAVLIGAGVFVALLFLAWVWLRYERARLKAAYLADVRAKLAAVRGVWEDENNRAFADVEAERIAERIARVGR
jgi:hypothetical protein